MKNNPMLILAVVASVAVIGSEAGFRCSLGEWACKGSCYVQFHNSG